MESNGMAAIKISIGLTVALLSAFLVGCTPSSQENVRLTETDIFASEQRQIYIEIPLIFDGDPGMVPINITIDDLPNGDSIKYVELTVPTNPTNYRQILRVEPKKPIAFLSLKTRFRMASSQKGSVNIRVMGASGEVYEGMESTQVPLPPGLDFENIATITKKGPSFKRLLEDKNVGEGRIVFGNTAGTDNLSNVFAILNHPNLPAGIGSAEDNIEQIMVIVDGDVMFTIQTYNAMSHSPYFRLDWPKAMSTTSDHVSVKYVTEDESMYILEAQYREK